MTKPGQVCLIRHWCQDLLYHFNQFAAIWKFWKFMNADLESGVKTRSNLIFWPLCDAWPMKWFTPSVEIHRCWQVDCCVKALKGGRLTQPRAWLASECLFHLSPENKCFETENHVWGQSDIGGFLQKKIVKRSHVTMSIGFIVLCPDLVTNQLFSKLTKSTLYSQTVTRHD